MRQRHRRVVARVGVRIVDHHFQPLDARRRADLAQRKRRSAANQRVFIAGQTNERRLQIRMRQFLRRIELLQVERPHGDRLQRAAAAPVARPDRDSSRPP